MVETTEGRDAEVARIAAALDRYGAYTERRGLHITADRLPAMLYDAGLRSTSRDSEVREAIEALPGWVKQRNNGTRFPDVIEPRAVDRAAVLAILDRSSEAAPTPRVCGCPATDGYGYRRTCNLPLDHAGMHSATDSAGTPTGAATWLWNGPHGLAFRDRGLLGASEAAPVVGLSEAWAKAEAALPEPEDDEPRWSIAVQPFLDDRTPPLHPEWRFVAAVDRVHVDRKAGPWNGTHDTLGRGGYGATPTEALLNLAARLTQTRTLGETVEP